MGIFQGYLLSTVANRIQALDFEASVWKAYVGLCALALIRGTSRKALETKVFGTEKASSNFKGAWTIATALHGHMSASVKADIAEQNIEPALEKALAFLSNHMTALGVAGKNAYAAVMHHPDGEALAAAKALADVDAKAEAEAKALADAEAEAAKAVEPVEPEGEAVEPEGEAVEPVTTGASVADVMAILADKDDAYLLAVRDFINATLAERKPVTVRKAA